MSSEDTPARRVSTSKDSTDTPRLPSIQTLDDDAMSSLTSALNNSEFFPRSFGMLDVRQEMADQFDALGANGRRPPKPPHPLEAAGLRGLRNIGNTCFMNSILQCLSNTEPLLEFVLGRRSFEINHSSKTKGELFLAFARFLYDLWNPKKIDDADTTVLKYRIENFCPTFRGACQHDAQELLRFLLEGLHNDLNRVSQKPPSKPLQVPDELPDEEKCRLAWDWSLKFDNSKITDIFLGQLKSTLTCLTCSHRSVTFDPFWDLSLPMPLPSVKGGSISLHECLALFTQEETLCGAEMPQCQKCRKQQSCTKRFNIQAFPDVLVVHLKRFTRDDRGKLKTVVKFPLENLDLGVYADYEVNNCAYNLCSVVNHCGTVASGHYVAYAKHPYSKDWHRYDDSHVTLSDSSDVDTVEPYLLFYELSLASKCTMDRDR